MQELKRKFGCNDFSDELNLEIYQGAPEDYTKIYGGKLEDYVKTSCKDKAGETVSTSVVFRGNMPFVKLVDILGGKRQTFSAESIEESTLLLPPLISPVAESSSNMQKAPVLVSAEPMHNAPAAATMQPSLASKEATSEEAQKGKELFLLVATSHPLIKFPFNQLHCWSGSKMVVFTYANGVQAKTNTSFLVDLKQIAELSFFGD